jgi:hypothetical protein
MDARLSIPAKIPLILSLLLISAGPAGTCARTAESPPDRVTTAGVADTSRVISPNGALVRSAILPGWGQIYNGYTVKGVAMMLAEATIIGLAVQADTRVRDLAVPGRDEQAEADLADWRKRREKRILLMIGLTLYSMADAFVDAHLIDFRDDETRFEVEVEPPPGRGRVPDLKLTLTIPFGRSRSH